VTVTFVRNNGSLTKDKYPGSKSQLFVPEKVTATFKCSGLGLNATSPYVLCSMLLFRYHCNTFESSFHILFVPPQGGGMGASVKLVQKLLTFALVFTLVWAIMPTTSLANNTITVTSMGKLWISKTKSLSW